MSDSEVKIELFRVDSETEYPNFKALGLESSVYPTDVSIQILNAENASMNWWDVIENNY
jgi:hypothetical protein